MFAAAPAAAYRHGVVGDGPAADAGSAFKISDVKSSRGAGDSDVDVVDVSATLALPALVDAIEAVLKSDAARESHAFKIAALKAVLGYVASKSGGVRRPHHASGRRWERHPI
jgi:hypothetical protein